MTQALNLFNSFVDLLGEEKFNLASDTLEIALCAAANAPVATNSVLANLTEISYANLSARTLSNVTWVSTSGQNKLDADDLTLTASGAVATFRYVVLFDQSAPADELICWWDYGGNLTMANTDTFLISFHSTNGILLLQ